MRIVVVCASENTAGTIGRWTYCSECNERIWLSNSSIEVIYASNPDWPEDFEPLIEPMCIPHGIISINEDKESKLIAPSDEQMSEIKKAIEDDSKNSD